MKVKPKLPKNKQVNSKDRDATEEHTNTHGKIITHKTQVGKGYLSMVLNQRQRLTAASDWEPYLAKHIEIEHIEQNIECPPHRMP